MTMKKRIFQFLNFFQLLVFQGAAEDRLGTDADILRLNISHVH